MQSTPCEIFKRKQNKQRARGISKGTWTQKQSSRWHFSSNERIRENCETKTANSAVKDHKSNQCPSPDGQNKREPWDQLSPLFRQNWRKKTETGFSRANFFFQVWRNVFAGVTYSARELSKFTTRQWISFYSKAFFFTNFIKSWLWLIRNL